MKRKLVPVLLVMVLLAAVACATLQAQWNALTSDQKARIILNDLQDQLSAAFDSGKVYIAVNPQYQDVWKQKIIPAFDMANKALATGLAAAKAGTITDADVFTSIQPLVTSALNLLNSIGWIKK